MDIKLFARRKFKSLSKMPSLTWSCVLLSYVLMSACTKPNDVGMERRATAAARSESAFEVGVGPIRLLIPRQFVPPRELPYYMTDSSELLQPGAVNIVVCNPEPEQETAYLDQADCANSDPINVTITWGDYDRGVQNRIDSVSTRPWTKKLPYTISGASLFINRFGRQDILHFKGTTAGARVVYGECELPAPIKLVDRKPELDMVQQMLARSPTCLLYTGPRGSQLTLSIRFAGTRFTEWQHIVSYVVGLVVSFEQAATPYPKNS